MFCQGWTHLWSLLGVRWRETWRDRTELPKNTLKITKTETCFSWWKVCRNRAGSFISTFRVLLLCSWHLSICGCQGYCSLKGQVCTGHRACNSASLRACAQDWERFLKVEEKDKTRPLNMKVKARHKEQCSWLGVHASLPWHLMARMFWLHGCVACSCDPGQLHAIIPPILPLKTLMHFTYYSAVAKRVISTMVSRNPRLRDPKQTQLPDVKLPRQTENISRVHAQAYARAEKMYVDACAGMLWSV